MRQQLSADLAGFKVLRAPLWRSHALPLLHVMKRDPVDGDSRPRIPVSMYLSEDVALAILKDLQQRDTGKILDPLVAEGFFLVFIQHREEQEAGIAAPPSIFIPFLGGKQHKSNPQEP